MNPDRQMLRVLVALLTASLITATAMRWAQNVAETRARRAAATSRLDAPPKRTTIPRSTRHVLRIAVLMLDRQTDQEAILDFVDLSDLSLVTLPSLFGMPRQLDLNGEEIEEARSQLYQLSLDFPGFELEAEEITLDEIKRRAESFDPLTMDINPEVLAVSAKVIG